MTLYLLITMFFGGGLIPTYLLIRGIGLLDDFWVLILPTMTSAFNIIIVRNFLMTIDKSLEESAFLDGASFYQILPKIILPLSKPVMAVIALWAAVQHWNAWFDALIYLPSKDKIVLQLLLRRMLQEVNYFQRALRNFEDITQVRLPSQSARAAVTILTIGPIILFYPFLQRYFVKGIFVGSLKG
jgi:putative aldouronate transport system permease protein